MQVDQGHETMVDSAWLAQYYWSEKHPDNLDGYGIVINGEDNYLTNVIVFAYTKTAVLVNGAANLLIG